MSGKSSKGGIGGFIHSWAFTMEVEVDPEEVKVTKEVKRAKVAKAKIKTWVRPAGIIFSLLYLIAVIVWFVIFEKGYQNFEPPVGSTVIKIKGAGAAQIKDHALLPGLAPGGNQPIWDSPEYSFPPMENNAFFIITRSSVTYNQTQGVCPTALDDNLDCTQGDTSKCKNETGSNDRSGFLTGQCVNSSEDTTKQVCQIKAWCPVENSKSIDYGIDIDSVRNFTVFIKTAILFASANTVIRTVKDNGFSSSCRFDEKDKINKRCPIFSLGYMIDNLKSQNGSVNQPDLFQKGGLILIEQDWDCNLDTRKGRENCFPAHHFRLLQGADDAISPGVNFRFASKQLINGIEYRTVTKVYGLRFVIVITGKGGSFSIVRLSTTIRLYFSHNIFYGIPPFDIILEGNLAFIGGITSFFVMMLNFGYTFEEQRKYIVKRLTKKICCKSDTEDDEVMMMPSMNQEQDSQIASVSENIFADTNQYANKQRSSNRDKRSRNRPKPIDDNDEDF